MTAERAPRSEREGNPIVKQRTSGPGSYFTNSFVPKPKRKGWAHGSERRRVKDGDEDGTFWTTAWGCGNSICSVCVAVDRGLHGPLCGWRSPEGGRCSFFAGHSHPGDHAMCPPHVHDHDVLSPDNVALVVKALGFDPFLEKQGPWVRDSFAKWNRDPWPAHPLGKVWKDEKGWV